MKPLIQKRQCSADIWAQAESSWKKTHRKVTLSIVWRLTSLRTNVNVHFHFSLQMWTLTVMTVKSLVTSSAVNHRIFDQVKQMRHLKTEGKRFKMTLNSRKDCGGSAWHWAGPHWKENSYEWQHIIWSWNWLLEIHFLTGNLNWPSKIVCVCVHVCVYAQ